MNSQLLYFDIETAPTFPDFDSADVQTKNFFLKKHENSNLYGMMDVFDYYKKHAGLFAEFSKIVCIVVAYHNGGVNFNFKVLYSDVKGEICSEKEMLQQFSDILKPGSVLCGHNIKGFDIPFLCKRYLANGLPVPTAINPTGKKTWDIQHCDTMEIAKFGNYQNSSSLDSLCYLIGIPSPKDEMDGSHVGDMYHSGTEDDLNKIAGYCIKDVSAVIKIYNALSGYRIFSGNSINIHIK